MKSISSSKTASKIDRIVDIILTVLIEAEVNIIVAFVRLHG